MILFVLDRESISVKGVFVFGGNYDTFNKTMARLKLKNKA